jgi:hypothetical protein
MDTVKSSYPGANDERRPGPVSAEEAENTDATICVPGADTATAHDECRTTEEVRQGHTGDHVRYILMFSFTGIVLVFAVLILFYVL